jgi:AAA family ATP:ADP antiporter
MGLRVANLFKALFNVEPHERLKLLLLTLTFFCVIASYTIIKELKDSIFVVIVGKSYIPYAKYASMIVLVPAILLYSLLVDRLRRYHLLYVYSIFYGVLGLVFALLLNHPVIGLANTDSSPYRIFGWLFYFFVEGYSPFMVSVFWAFANSVTDPDEAKKNYGLMVSGSKLGGMFSAGLAWIILSHSNPFADYVSSDIARHQLLLAYSSLMVLAVPFTIMMLMKNVSGKYMHGYEAAYKVEKERRKAGEEKTGLFAGLQMFIKYPYLLGIFCMVFFHEIISTVLNYQKVGIAQANSSSVADISSFLFQVIFWTHLIGFLISLLGTKTLMNKLGERLCLLLIPVATGLLLFYFMFNYTPFGLLSILIIMRAINYGFSYPVRESLYIPTVKEIKFKSKSWIDAFGSKFAKTTGSTFNVFAEYLGEALIFTAYGIFFAGIIGVWVVAAILLGKRFEKAVARNEVIGAEKEEKVA